MTETAFIPVAQPGVAPEAGSPPVAHQQAAAIDKIRARGVAVLRKCPVPEWGFDVYFGPLVANDLIAVAEREPKTVTERDILLLVMKAKDEQGVPLFRMGDAHTLRSEAEYAVLKRLIEFMYESAFPGIKAAEEEIAADPTSASG